jgi:hypothetical protein
MFDPMESHFDVRDTVLVLVHGEIRFRHVEKIANLVEIDFEIGNFDLKLQIRVQRVNMVENVLHDSRNNTLLTLDTHDTLARTRSRSADDVHP